MNSRRSGITCCIRLHSRRLQTLWKQRQKDATKRRYLLRTTRCHILENWTLQSIDSRHRHITLSRQKTTVRNLCHFRTSQLRECEVTVFQDVIWLNSVTFQTTKQKPTILCWNGGTAVAQWLRCCATNRKVAGSIPVGVSGFFIDIKSFRSTQPLTEMSTRSISWG